MPTDDRSDREDALPDVPMSGVVDASSIRDRVDSLWSSLVPPTILTWTTIKMPSQKVRGSRGPYIAPGHSSDPRGTTGAKPTTSCWMHLANAGWGVVYSARQASMDRRIAVKMMKPAFLERGARQHLVKPQLVSCRGGSSAAVTAEQRN